MKRIVKITLGLLPSIAIAIWILKWIVIGVHHFVVLSIDHGWHPYSHCERIGLEMLQFFATALGILALLCVSHIGFVEARKSWKDTP